MAPLPAFAPPVENHPVEREAARLEAVERYGIYDTGPDPRFDRVARLIRNIFDLPIAIVSIIDGHRQTYKAVEGIANQDIALKDTFCQYALYSENLVVPDAKQDARFRDHPFVTGDANIRFYAGVPMTTAEGHSIGTVCAIGTEPRQFSDREKEILADLAQLAMNEIELRYRATTDVLTNALTRRAFMEASAKAHMHALRHNQSLACIVLDIDHFKGVNDRFGHAAGDNVLAKVASACAERLRAADIFGRIGGEEFAIMLPLTDKASAVTLAKRLREAVSQTEVILGGRRFQITASFGVSDISISTMTVEALIAQADTALYNAKSAGRDRVVAWSGATSSAADIRRRVLKAGKLLYKNGAMTVDCTVRTISDKTAGMDVMDTSYVPDRFTLSISSEALERQCRVVSRTSTHLEVEFQ